MAFFQAPEQFDIVYGRFPYADNPSDPAPDPHYCLVLNVFEDENGNPWVIVAFGTSAKWHSAGPGEFRVQPSDGDAFQKTGLQKKTKFSLRKDRLAKLPYNDEWFGVPPERRPSGITPKIGTLSFSRYGLEMKKAGQAVSIIDALADLERLSIGTFPKT